MKTVTIQLVSGPPVVLEVENVEQVMNQLERGKQYVRFEVPETVYFINPAHVVSVSVTG